jgi:hypothetical protein
MKDKGQMKIKNHMAKRGKRIQNMMGNTFGIDTAFLIKCWQLITKLMPKIKDAALNTIQGTQDLNVGLAEVIKQAASSSIAIGKASSDVVLAQQRYQNEKQEIARGFTASKDIEALRHNQTIDYIRLNAWVEKNMMTVDGNVRLLETTNKPELRQIDADLARRDKVAEHLLKYGDVAQPQLIPTKNYGGIVGGLSKLKQAILGF